jgi:multicomponent Na+:H+ antiporter subunit G
MTSSLRARGRRGRMTAWIADVLIVLGLIVMTLGVHGIVRFPDVFTQPHASSKAAFGSILLVATALAGSSRSPLGNAVSTSVMMGS